jgi:Domain of unknown function (DUF4234)
MDPLLPFGAKQAIHASTSALLLARAPLAGHAIRLRSPARMVVLSAVTFGAYGLYWLHRALTELRQATGDKSIVPLRAVVLSLLTFGLYAHVYLRARNTQLRDWMNEGEVVNLSYATALLPIVGRLMLIAWFQTRLNRLAAFATDAHGHPHPDQRQPWVDMATGKHQHISLRRDN